MTVSALPDGQPVPLSPHTPMCKGCGPDKPAREGRVLLA